jgi:hypothetical protein
MMAWAVAFCGAVVMQGVLHGSKAELPWKAVSDGLFVIFFASPLLYSTRRRWLRTLMFCLSAALFLSEFAELRSMP